MVHPSTDIFSSRELGWPRQPFYLGVYHAMRAFKIVAVALLVATLGVIVQGAPGSGGDNRAASGDVEILREHIL